APASGSPRTGRTRASRAIRPKRRRSDYRKVGFGSSVDRPMDECMTVGSDRAREQLSMARAAALLLIAGAALGLLQIVVPHPQHINTQAYAIIDAAGLVGAAVVWRFRRSLPVAAYHLVSLFGIACVALAIYYSGNGPGGDTENELLFLW